MNNEIRKEEVQNIEDKISKNLVVLENACKEFLKATEEYLAEWYQKCAKSGLIANAKAAVDLGTEGLRRIKGEMNDLIKKLPELIDAQVNTKKWPHRGSLPDDCSRKFGISFVKELRTEHLEDAVHGLFGHIGALLVRHNLSDGDWDMKIGYELPTYRMTAAWTENMESALRKYADACDVWINLATELKKVEKKVTEAEISDLWDRL
ncbi:MAG: hypothetical protein HY809_03190 [Nitrospirae bacterium]|nr:hypothetical protein [Nitrospirota bacterium]